MHEKAGLFGRFNVAWTPTVLIMSPKGVERWRLEGYHSPSELVAWMKMGLARVQFMAKRFGEAEKWYAEVAAGSTSYSPEAKYWQAVCQYNQSHDPAPLQQVGRTLHEQHPSSPWAMRTNAWLPDDHPANRVSLR